MMQKKEIKQQKKINHIYFDKFLFVLLIVIFIFSSIIVKANGWLDFALARFDDLPKYLSEKLSKPGKYSIKIESLKNTFPIITGNNITYNSINNVSSLSFKIKEISVNLDYSNPELGTHSFKISNANLFFKKRKNIIKSNCIQMDGQYGQQKLHIASSTWKLFGGRAYINGLIDTKEKPPRYNIYTELFSVRLKNILSHTKNKGSFTGDIFGTISVNNNSENPSLLLGYANLSVYNGTYYQPKLVDKINHAFHKIGLQSKLKNIAETIASNTFFFNGDFLIYGNSYLTDNAIFITPWGRIKFSGRIGPKSSVNGVVVVYYKHYSSFSLKINGSNSKNINYKISDSDKTHLVSIMFREASKGTERQIKKEGHRFNKDIKKIGKKSKRFFNKI